jgi:predicted acetyltransferase
VNGQPLRLVEPTVALRDAYTALVLDFRAAGEPFHQNYFDALRDFPAFVHTLRREARGENLPPDKVPCTHFWALCGETVVGTVRLRHRLTPTLERFGGHIGYDVRPSERHRGYATAMLALVLPKARELGLQRVLLTCNTENAVSARVIEKNGGVVADRSIDPRSGKMAARYWIDLQTSPAVNT